LADTVRARFAFLITGKICVKSPPKIIDNLLKEVSELRKF
jgi:hypothetical protein